MSYLRFRRKLMHNKEFKMTTFVNLGKFPWNFVQFEATWLHWRGLWHGQLFALYSDLSSGFAVGCPCLLFYFIYPFKCSYWVATVLGTVPLAEDKEYWARQTRQSCLNGANVSDLGDHQQAHMHLGCEECREQRDGDRLGKVWSGNPLWEVIFESRPEWWVTWRLGEMNFRKEYKYKDLGTLFVVVRRSDGSPCPVQITTHIWKMTIYKVLYYLQGFWMGFWILA